MIYSRVLTWAKKSGAGGCRREATRIGLGKVLSSCLAPLALGLKGSPRAAGCHHTGVGSGNLTQPIWGWPKSICTTSRTDRAFRSQHGSVHPVIQHAQLTRSMPCDQRQPHRINTGKFGVETGFTKLREGLRNIHHIPSHLLRTS